MKGLVDTHAFLWFVWNHPKLTAPARTFMSDPNNDLFISAGSLWEMGIKVSIGKLNLTEPLDTFLNRELPKNRVAVLPMAIAHLATVSTLPFHHRDPFDRLIIAQAKVEQMPIVSGDQVFDAYSVQRIW